MEGKKAPCQRRGRPAIQPEHPKQLHTAGPWPQAGKAPLCLSKSVGAPFYFACSLCWDFGRPSAVAHIPPLEQGDSSR